MMCPPCNRRELGEQGTKQREWAYVIGVLMLLRGEGRLRTTDSLNDQGNDILHNHVSV
jgi:hypothetical protein